jgi:hypothetical protein
MHKLITALCVIFVCNAWAGIGTVAEHKGTACEITRGKNKLPGHKGADVESMDTYTTGACVSSITFKDDTKVRITENSRLLIDDFVFDPKANDAGKLALKVGAGTVRYTSGQIAKNSPQKVNIQTPTATVAVRGTDFTMTVDEAGQSLVMLIPSCKDISEVKQYELEENRCRVGRIEVSTLAGSVVLDQAFEATYVMSAMMSPTPPTVVNTVESKINNNFIIIKPVEVQRAIKEATKTKQEQELDDIEADAARRLAQTVAKSAEAIEEARVAKFVDFAKRSGCNPATGVCVIWDRPGETEMMSRGRGIAFRLTENEHYAEVKTLGYLSNTTVNITHNDVPASIIIGDGSPGGTIVTIKQNNGVLKSK